MPHESFANNQSLKYNLLAIEISPTCKGIKSGCPTYADLIFFDKTNQYISGKFVTDSSGLHRERPEIKNSWSYYDYSSGLIPCVDCYFPGGLGDGIPIITIQPHGFTWIDPNENSTNGRSVHAFSDIYISKDCYNADEVFSKTILNDTINYMLNHCVGTKPSSLNRTSLTSIKNTPFSFDNPYSSLIMAKLYKNILHDHYIFGNYTSGGLGPGDCIHHTCNLTTSQKKW